MNRKVVVPGAHDRLLFKPSKTVPTSQMAASDLQELPHLPKDVQLGPALTSTSQVLEIRSYESHEVSEGLNLQFVFRVTRVQNDSTGRPFWQDLLT